MNVIPKMLNQLTPPHFGMEICDSKCQHGIMIFYESRRIMKSKLRSCRINFNDMNTLSLKITG